MTPQTEASATELIRRVRDFHDRILPGIRFMDIPAPAKVALVTHINAVFAQANDLSAKMARSRQQRYGKPKKRAQEQTA